MEEKLGNIMRSIADICLKKGLITEADHESYYISGILFFAAFILYYFTQ